jgi:hypothetical protein
MTDCEKAVMQALLKDVADYGRIRYRESICVIIDESEDHFNVTLARREGPPSQTSHNCMKIKWAGEHQGQRMAYVWYAVPPMSEGCPQGCPQGPVAAIPWVIFAILYAGMPSASWSKEIKAPWTPEQVEALWRHQVNPIVHPYTCICGENLVPTPDGWVCEKCPYRQNWAHDLAEEYRGSYKRGLDGPPGRIGDISETGPRGPDPTRSWPDPGAARS